MGRTYLPENQGMLFHYSPPLNLRLWSFNCYIPLSVAFLDNEQVIFHLCDLYAYPERMDPHRPIRTFQDLTNYSYSDPIVQFFLENSVCAQAPASYVLEMNHGWFERHGIKVGDRLVWKGTQGVLSRNQH